MNRPIIGITIGDPAGIGPEITVKTLQNKTVYDVCKPIVIGDAAIIEEAAKICSIPMHLHRVVNPAEGTYDPGTIDIMDMNTPGIGSRVVGKIQGACGKAAFEYIRKSVESALAHELAAVATGPVNKEAFREGGVEFIGHTEILAELADAHDPLTMFEVRNLRVFFLSRHVSLRKACDMVTKDRLLDYIHRCSAALRQLGADDGIMAVAGLNPHNGEHGLFGNEEVLHIEPAVREAQRLGYRVEGPLSPDSVFHQALQGKYSAVLSLYHDQGHIATKTLDFERTVSLTLGLPFLRTSVDHGTAFDIAGTGKASPVSLTEAVLVAAKYAGKFRPL